MAKRKISRRSFLGQASCAAIGSTAFLSSALNLGMINTLAARPHIITNTNDYKAMVCILLAGGADTYNVIVPTEQSEYDDYAATRGDLALDKDATDPAQLIDLEYNDDGRTFAVHSGMDKVRDMFDGGELSFVANIGTLVEPIANVTDYENGNKKRPLGLYSHSDQIIEYSISRNTTEANIGYEQYPSWWHDSGMINDMRNSAINNIAEQEYANIFAETIGDLTKQTGESIEIFREAMGRVQPLNTEFSSTNLSNDLKKIAETISVRQHLGSSRQIFFVTLGGWDHHDNVLGNQAAMLPMVSNALLMPCRCTC